MIEQEWLLTIGDARYGQRRIQIKLQLRKIFCRREMMDDRPLELLYRGIHLKHQAVKSDVISAGRSGNTSTFWKTLMTVRLAISDPIDDAFVHEDLRLELGNGAEKDQCPLQHEH